MCAAQAAEVYELDDTGYNSMGEFTVVEGQEDVAKLGKELYKRLSVMGGHAASVGRALETAVGKYNQFVGSLESQVMVSARRFEDLQVDHEGKALPDLTPVETAPRVIARPELIASSKSE